MTTDHNTYTYECCEEETVTLSRGPATPTGHAVLTIKYSDGQIVDCYVDLAWLRDRADQLADTPRPLTPDAITDEMVLRFMNTYDRPRDGAMDAPTLNHFAASRTSLTRSALTAALTEPTRPEGAEDIERLIRDAENEGQGADNEALANYLAARLTDPTRKEA